MRILSSPVSSVYCSRCATIFHSTLEKSCCKYCSYLRWYNVCSGRSLSPFYLFLKLIVVLGNKIRPNFFQLVGPLVISLFFCIHNYLCICSQNLQSRKFYVRRNNNKVDSTETGRIVIAHLLPWSDLENCMQSTLF